MTTIIDPLGTPSAVYNKSGTAIVELTAPWTTPRTVVQIPSVAQTTIAWVDSSNPLGTGTEPHVELPAAAEIGDVVEVYSKPYGGFSGLTVVAPSGEYLGGSTSFTSGNGGVRCRKVDATTWYKSSN